MRHPVAAPLVASILLVAAACTPGGSDNAASADDPPVFTLPLDETVVEGRFAVDPDTGLPLFDPGTTIDTVRAELIGLDMVAAENWAAENDLILRVVTEDGQPLPLNLDLNPRRINVVVVDGVITEVDDFY